MSERSHLNAIHNFHVLKERYGGEEQFKSSESWVFPTDGTLHGEGFGEDYLCLLAGARKSAEKPFDNTLLFGLPIKENAKTGEDAEKLYFSYFEFVSDFFSHPQNAGSLGLLVRKFISNYSGEEILQDLTADSKKMLEKAEKALVDENGGNHASVTDVLRLMYNRSIAIASATGTGKEVGAIDLGPGGRRLTPIGLHPTLDAKLRMEEILSARNGQSYCVDSLSGKIFKRGAWSSDEWEEARVRIQAESGMAVEDKMKHTDGFYFQEKVTHLVGASYNLVKNLRDISVQHCEEKTFFSIEKMANRLHTEGVGVKPNLRKIADYDYPEEPDFEMLPEGTDLEPAGLNPPQLALPSSGKSKRPQKSEKDKKMDTFTKHNGNLTTEDRKTLEEILERKQGFSPEDYSDSLGGFVKGGNVQSSCNSNDVREWQKKAPRARSKEEAEFLITNTIQNEKRGKTSVLVSIGEGVVEGHREGGKIIFQTVRGGELEKIITDRKGTAFVNTNSGSFKVLPIGAISRIPYRPHREDKKNGVALKRGSGILSSIKELIRGGK